MDLTHMKILTHNSLIWKTGYLSRLADFKGFSAALDNFSTGAPVRLPPMSTFAKGDVKLSKLISIRLYVTFYKRLQLKKAGELLYHR